MGIVFISIREDELYPDLKISPSDSSKGTGVDERLVNDYINARKAFFAARRSLYEAIYKAQFPERDFNLNPINLDVED
jgi:hypothetical protein